MADEKQSGNSIFTFIRGTSKILERLQREDEKEIESDNPASDYESDLGEASGDITDPSAYDGAPVDQYSEGTSVLGRLQSSELTFTRRSLSRSTQTSK